MWDDVLAQVPEYGDGYYWRALGRSLAANGVGYLDRYIQDNLDALADLDTALELVPAADGRNYRRRHVILTDLMGVTPYRVNEDSLLELALENLQTALAIGPGVPPAQR
jgi:hypothetical protein